MYDYGGNPSGQNSADYGGGGAQPGGPTTSNPSFGGRPRPRGPRRAPQQVQPNQPQTFAQMQAQGVARPAPPSPLQQTTQNLTGAVNRSLNSPSRYATDSFRASLESGLAQLDQGNRADKTRLDEEMARRGVAASSVASGYNGDLLGQQSVARSSLLSNLLANQANNEAADSAVSLNAGQALQSALAGQTLANRQFAQSGEQFDKSLALNAELGRGNLDVSRQQANTSRDVGMGNLQLGRDQLTQSGGQFDRSLQEQVASRLQQGGFNQQELTLKAEQIRQDAALQGRSLSMQEAQNLASNELARNAQGIQDRQFNRSLDESGAQFSRSLGEQQAARESATAMEQEKLRLQTQLGQGDLQVRRDQLAQGGNQFDRSLNEQVATRLQQLGLSQQEVDLKAKQIQQEAALQGRSLSIQEAQNQASNELAKSAQSIQQGQFGQEVELRAKQLQQDAALQGRSMSIQEAQNQATNELASRSLGADTEYKRGQLALSGRSLDQSGQQFDKSFSLDQQRAELEQKVQTGQLSVAQASAELQRIAQEQNYGLAVRSQDTQNAQFGRSLDEQVAGRLQQAGISQRDFELRAQQLQQEAALQGRSLSMQEAQNIATNELAKSSQSIQQSQFNRTQDEAGAQFSRSLGEQQAAREQANAMEQERLRVQNQLGQGNLSLGRDQLTQSGTQFQSQLEQALKLAGMSDTTQRELATMSDKTQNRAVDLNAQNAQNDWLRQVIAILSQMGGYTKTAGGAEVPPGVIPGTNVNLTDPTGNPVDSPPTRRTTLTYE